MIVAVTGATGFIGRALVAALREAGVEVLAVSRGARSEGFPDGVHALSLDVERPDPGALRELAAADRLVHLAWDTLRDFRARRHFEVLLPAHHRFLAALLDAGLRRLCVAGTCLEYGLQSGALHEALPARPVTAYGFAKHALWRQLTLLDETIEARLLWPRFFYLYGPGQPEGTLYSQVQAAIAEGARRFAMSPGEQLRDYLPVDEAARLLARLVTGSAAGVVNLCSGRPVSVRSLVEGWFEAAGARIALDRGRYGYPDYEPLAFWGDRERLDALLEAR